MTWRRAALLTDISSETPLPVSIGETPLALYNIDGKIYATGNVCTHQDAWLSDGFIAGDCIECPLHAGLFHIPSGEVRGGPVSEGIKTYAVRIDGGEVYVKM